MKEALSLTIKPSEGLFNLPLGEYLKERERRCKKSLEILGLYGPNDDLAPLIVGLWYRDYWEAKCKLI